jgi:8-oxo-dGTP diphosphatase
MLAARRLPSGNHPALFEFPGGKIIAGETPFEAVRREIGEELGLEIRPLAQKPSLRHQYPGRCIELIPVLCDRPRGIPKLTAHSEIRWIRPDRWRVLDWLEADRLLIQNLISAKGTPALCKKISPTPAKPTASQKRQPPKNPRRQK